MTKNLPNIILYLWILVGFSHLSLGQNHLYWHQIKPPLYTDFTQIATTGTDSLLIAGKKLLVYNQHQWRLFDPQPPCQIKKIRVIGPNQIYVSNVTPYQNSDLFFWNGKIWQKITHPLANNINDMFFTDAQNGALVSYGEIAILKNGNWQHLPPPNNHNFNAIVVFQKHIFTLIPPFGLYKYIDKHWLLISQTQKVKKLIIKNNRLFVLGNGYLGEILHSQLKILSNHKVWQAINDIDLIDHKIIGVGNTGLIITWTPQKMSYEKSGVKEDLLQIVHHNAQIWIVGHEGTILNLKSGKPKRAKTYWKGFKQLTFNQNAKITDDEYSVVTADFNNDGLVDIFTAGLFEDDRLYINQGHLKFSNQAKAFGLTKLQHQKTHELNLGACAGDLDHDGYIDLYISVLNGKNIIYKNINGKYFVNYSKISGATGLDTDRSNACIMGDVDNDGDLDIFVANEFSTNRLYLNNGVGIFKEITAQSGLKTIEGGNSASFSDYDRDGDLDLMVTNWSHINKLYKNMLKETGRLFFKDVSTSAGIKGQAYDKSNAVIFTDLNNDGYPDLFITNRKTSNRLYINNKNGTFKDQTAQLIGLDSMASYGAVITDFDGDGYKDIYICNVGENKFYKNVEGKYKDLTQKYGAQLKGYSTGAALADFDNDGDLDIYVANYVGAGSTLFENNADPTKFYKINIESYLGNYQAIGSKISVYDAQNNLETYDEITSGSGYVSMNNPQPVLAIPKLPATIKIEFPNGQSISRKIDADTPKTIGVTDVSPMGKYTQQLLQKFKQNILDPHLLSGNLKFLLVLIFLFYSSKRGLKKLRWSIKFATISSLAIAGFYYYNYSHFQYQNIVFSTILPFSAVLVLIFLLHYYFERQIIKKEAELKQKEIKQKISRNLHDDLSDTLSSVGLYNAMIQQQVKAYPAIRDLTRKSEILLEEATETVTDLIWSIQPQTETLHGIMLRLLNNFKPLFDTQKTKLEISWQENNLKEIKLQDLLKQNTFLILKEALNNTLKYAQATHISIQIKSKNKWLIISIRDDGQGFNLKQKQFSGRGLQNMRNRAQEMPQGSFEINSGVSGTKITFQFKLK